MAASDFDRFDHAERALRIELAACYRIFAHLGWTDLIFNHITVRVPGPDRHYLINPFGLDYEEITASSLIKLDLEGRPVESGPYPVNRAGFIIHGAIHRSRPDAHCVMHTHTRAGEAVSCKKEGLSHNTFYGALLTGSIAYHGFEGVTVHEDEQPRLIENLGSKNMLILRNHGLLTCGADIADCFWNMWSLQRACEAQCGVDTLRGENQQLSAEVLEATRKNREASLVDPDMARTVFAALRRKIDRGTGSSIDYRA